MTVSPDAVSSRRGAAVARAVPGGIADQLGIAAGDVIAAIDGEVPSDILDYQFRTSPGNLRLLVVKPDGEQWDVEIEKDEGEPLGLDLREELFDRVRRCANRCFFCFVDQLPPGLREGLYVKDDDYRLSVLYGNFVTLSNLTPRDDERLRVQRLSPLRVSIHTTDPELRARMLGNPSAPPVLEQLQRLLSWGIEVHGQVVLCPGINDGPALERTFGDLLSLRPPLSSLAVVPVGVTKYAPEGLRRYDGEGAGRVLDALRPWEARFRSDGVRRLFAADELYLLAGRELPAEEEYGCYPQLDNGVGMCRTFISGFAKLLERSTLPGLAGPESVLLLTGELFAPVLDGMVRKLSARGRPKVETVACRNRLFGPEVTVAGLLSGRDLLEGAASAHGRPDLIVLPRQAFRAAGDLTLDGLGLDDLRRELGVPAIAAGSAEELTGLLLGRVPVEEGAPA